MSSNSVLNKVTHIFSTADLKAVVGSCNYGPCREFTSRPHSFLTLPAVPSISVDSTKWPTPNTTYSC